MSNIRVIERSYPVDHRAHVFFQSFIELTSADGVLSVSDRNAIHEQSMTLLQSRLKAYTENSSVRLDIAERIMASNLYTMSYYLRKLPHNCCIEELRHTPLTHIYQLGKAAIWRDVDETKSLLRGILKNRIQTRNKAYNDTIIKGIPLFFSSYDVDFFAHDTPGSIDYPLSMDAMDTCGIEYMLRYLRMLTMENQLCRTFPTEDIAHLLRGHSASYANELINIFSIILLNLAGNVLLDNPITLNISSANHLHLGEMLRDMPTLKLKLMLGNTSHTICDALGIEHEGMISLITQTLMHQSTQVINALENNCLKRVFITYKADTPTLTFEEGASMDDVTFRRVVKRIRKSDSEDKPSLIRAHAKSFTDLVDILEAYCIVDEEHTMLYESLSDMELALLLLRTSDDTLHTSESQRIWQGWLRRYMQSLDDGKQRRIIVLSQTLSESAP